MTRAACYLRVSTDEQAKCGTIETQRQELLAFCEREQLHVERFYEDDGVSGAVPIEERPAGRQLMTAAKRGEFDVLVVYKLDRLGREPFDVLGAVSLLKAKGIRLLSPTEQFQDGSAGSLYTGIRAVFAGFEREVIRERTVAGKARKAREGGWCGGPPPFGYRIANSLTPQSRLEICPETAPIARQIFEWCIKETVSAGEIARRLTAMGARTRRGDRWYTKTVREILKNPVYKGEVAHHRGYAPELADDIREAELAIVSGREFELAQRVLATNRQRWSGKAKLDYLLAGLVTCHHCGRPYVGGLTVNSGREYAYYRCNARKLHQQGNYADTGERCIGRPVPKAKLENAVWNALEFYLRNPNALADRLAAQYRHAEDARQHAEDQLRNLQQQLAAKDGERQQVIALCRRGLITARDLDIQLGQVATEEAELRRLIASVEADTRNASLVEMGLPNLIGELAALRAGEIDFEDIATRTRLVKSFIDRVFLVSSADADDCPTVSARVVFLFGGEDRVSGYRSNRADNQSGGMSFADTLAVC